MGDGAGLNRVETLRPFRLMNRVARSNWAKGPKENGVGGSQGKRVRGLAP